MPAVPPLVAVGDYCVSPDTENAPMGDGMAWTKPAASLEKICRATIVAECAGIVGTAVEWWRERSASVKEAEARAAHALGITPRRVRGYRAGEVQHVSAEEAELLRAGWKRLAAVQMAQLRAEIEKLEARSREIEARCHGL